MQSLGLGGLLGQGLGLALGPGLDNCTIYNSYSRCQISSTKSVSLSLFKHPSHIFDSQKKPNDSQDKFHFLSCGCGGFERWIEEEKELLLSKLLVEW